MKKLSNMSMRLGKKASLQLSINAIVILILAITMLGLGLGFMKGLFSKTTGQLEQVGDDIKNQMIEQLRTSSAKLTLNQEDITLKRGASKDVYFAVKNVLPNAKAFPIVIGCPTALGEGSGEVTIENFGTTREMANGEMDVQKFVLTAPSTAHRTTHSCQVTLDGDYAKKSFFVTVQ